MSHLQKLQSQNIFIKSTGGGGSGWGGQDGCEQRIKKKFGGGGGGGVGLRGGSRVGGVTVNVNREVKFL